MSGRHNLPRREGTRLRTAVFFAAAWLVILCPLVGQAQIAAGSAQVIKMVGRVSIERGGELWAVSDGQAVEAGQIIVTGIDGSAQLGLPDGSQVEIFPNSRVIYRANHFNLRDFLDLYLGKIRLQIQHILPGETPLRVTSPTAVISVRGTVFEVEVDSAQDTTVSVDSGAVSVRHRLVPGQEVMVESGQSLRVVASLPLTASVKSPVPLRTVGRIVRAVTDTLTQISSARGSSGSSTASGGAAAPSPGGAVSSSDSGSNQTKPPAGEDDTGGSTNTGGASGGTGGGNSAPPGDVLP